jgi:hypothetical protein
MKKMIFPAVAILFLITACNNEKKEAENSDETPSAKVALPYTVEYSDFKWGDPNHTKLVLDFYKTWEENRLADGRPMLTDSVTVDFADGMDFNGTADSLLKMGTQFRDMYTSVKITVDAAMAVHSNDKNEDWVLIWDRAYTTDKQGKVDSMGGQSYWLIKNHKIAYWGESQAKLAPPPPSNQNQ